MSRIKRSGGFVFAEFAIALPLLILLFYGLATVGLQIFHLGRIQLADYVLEEEVHDVLSRMIYDARAAKSLNLTEPLAPDFTYRTINPPKSDGGLIADVEEHRVYKLYGTLKQAGSKIEYKLKFEGDGNPITGDNYFGATRVMDFKCRPDDADKKLLHITLEMQSEISGHKIKIITAVYMPGCETFIP